VRRAEKAAQIDALRSRPVRSVRLASQLERHLAAMEEELAQLDRELAALSPQAVVAERLELVRAALGQPRQ
jgi:hypothetical protein